MGENYSQKHHAVNEILGNIKHYLKLKKIKIKIWGSQLRLKAQLPCWFFALRLTWAVFFSPLFLFFFFLNIYKVHPWIWNEHWWDESSSYRVVPTPAGSVQSQGLTARESAHIHQHTASQRQRDTEASCETWLTGKLHTFSAAHRKHTAQTSARHMQGSLGLEKPWSLGSEAAEPLHIPGFSSPTTPRLCQHTCLYGHMVNQAKEIKVPGLFYRYSNCVSLYIWDYWLSGPFYLPAEFWAPIW